MVLGSDKMKIFLFPYAGGSAKVYTQFEKYINPEITLSYIEYKGHGSRSKEDFYESVEDAVDDILTQIKPQITDEPYVLFGHSMGGLLIYELVKKVQQLNVSYPMHVFISARKAPHLKQKKDYMIYQLPEKEFIEEVSSIGGLEEELLSDEIIRGYFLPIIRADYKIIEEYKSETINPFKCGMTLCYATGDIEAGKDEVLEWEKYSQSDINVFEFEGGHFYFKLDCSILCNIINNTLNQLI